MTSHITPWIWSTVFTGEQVANWLDQQHGHGYAKTAITYQNIMALGHAVCDVHGQNILTTHDAKQRIFCGKIAFQQAAHMHAFLLVYGHACNVIAGHVMLHGSRLLPPVLTVHGTVELKDDACDCKLHVQGNLYFQDPGWMERDWPDNITVTGHVTYNYMIGP